MTNHPRSPRAKFRIGQIVSLPHAKSICVITEVFPWPECKRSPFGYVFMEYSVTLGVRENRANQKYLRPLTKKEAGR